MAKKPQKRKKRPRIDRLTPKQQRFLEVFQEVETAGMAAVIAGYSPKNPAQSGYQALRDIKAKAVDILDAHGLTCDHLIQNYLSVALNAKRPMFVAKNGKQIEFVMTNDWPARVRALDIAFKLRGDYATTEDVMKDATSVRVIRIDVPRPRPPEVQKLPGNGKPPVKKTNGGADD